MKKRIFFFFLPFLLLLVIGDKAMAQSDTSSDWHISGAYNYLYSTHSTKFRGPAIVLDKDINKHWTVGIGTSYITCPYHFDNGYDLKNLKFVPIYALAQYTFSHHKIFDPYVLAKMGITIMRYDQRWNGSGDPYQAQHQTGWYCYGGGGTKINVFRNIQLFVNIGLIGYKMSFNDLDINPHGVAGDIGCRIKI